MLSTKEVINILKKFKTESASKYGITSLGLFGSFARNQQRETSDVDVFVTLKESDFFVLERIKEEMPSSPEVEYIVSFVEGAKRGIIK
mgnify:CR=1 FL=1